MIIREIAKGIVKEHIDAWDPMNLFDLGVPNDEYETEIEMVINEFPSIVNEADLTEVIQETFNTSFGFDQNRFNYQECSMIAVQIWKDILKLTSI